MGIFRAWSLILILFLFQSCASIKAQEGPRLSLNDFDSSSKATVFFWWATQCPCVTRYQSRIEDLARRYSSQGVSFFAIASNSDDDPASVKQVAHEKNFSLPIKIDTGGHFATQFGVRTTPTVVIVDKSGQVKYRGWIDNERYAGDAARIAYAENALNEVLQEREVTAVTSPIYGCRITKRLR